MPLPPVATHLNLLWSSLIVAECIKNGIDTFFLSPGNRNAPLISALANEERAVKKLCLDERAAAYRALGYTKATGRPGVLVCTSGTAPANYYPAMIEACREDLPMIVLSADRPPELVGSDANQTIFQENLYGRYCRDTLLLPCPDAHYPLEALLAKLDYVLCRPSGPVHINCPFRDPLTPGISGHPPVDSDILSKAGYLFDQPKPYTTYAAKTCLPDLDELLKIIGNTRKGLIVIGRPDYPEDSGALERLLQKINWPVYCDIASSLKSVIPADRQIFTFDHAEAIRLMKDYEPDTILQFGSGLVSKHYYASILPHSKAVLIEVSPRTGLRDPAHRVNLLICAPIHVVARRLEESLASEAKPEGMNRLMASMQKLYDQVQTRIEPDTLSFAFIAQALLGEVPEGEALFPGNSIAVRAFDMVLPDNLRRIRVISNRGVSGIEGNIATCVGFAEGSGRRVTAVIGDISFLHDLNSLVLMRQSTVPVILAIVNNGGGRIFERLPIKNFPEILNPYMTTPHDMTFRHAALQFDLPYFRIDKPAELIHSYQQALKDRQPALLELIVSPAEDLRIFQSIQQIRLP